MERNILWFHKEPSKKTKELVLHQITLSEGISTGPQKLNKEKRYQVPFFESIYQINIPLSYHETYFNAINHMKQQSERIQGNWPGHINTAEETVKSCFQWLLLLPRIFEIPATAIFYHSLLEAASYCWCVLVIYRKFIYLIKCHRRVASSKPLNT